ncbi:MAG TPA: Clp protease N-terminal domain-containing protein [Puia sp.]|nr:Clp protease N-terminal domain-containing protein [Puia sp.]
MANRFSTEFKETISLSAEEAIRTHSPVIGPGHLLLGLIRHGQNSAVTILTQELGLSLPALKEAVEALLPPAVDHRTAPGKTRVSLMGFRQSNRLCLDRGAERSLRGSVLKARRMESRTVGADHLLFSLFGDRDNQLYLVFRRWGIDRLPGAPGAQ